MAEIPLHGTTAAGRAALVDDEDYANLAQYRWHAVNVLGRDGKIIRTVAKRHRPAEQFRRAGSVSMHEMIMGARYVSHVNGDGLDNRRSNLRLPVGRYGGY